MFQFVSVRDIVGGSSREAGMDLLRRIHGSALPEAAARQLLAFCENINRYAASIRGEDAATAQALTISLRQVLRLARGVAFQQGKLGHSTSVGSMELYEAAQESLLSQFLPGNARTAVDSALREAGVARPDGMYATTRATAGSEAALIAEHVTADDGSVSLRLGDLVMPLRRPANVRERGISCSTADGVHRRERRTCSLSWFHTHCSTPLHTK